VALVIAQFGHIFPLRESMLGRLLANSDSSVALHPELSLITEFCPRAAQQTLHGSLSKSDFQERPLETKFTPVAHAGSPITHHTSRIRLLVVMLRVPEGPLAL
jgi:hypothetical protein